MERLLDKALEFTLLFDDDNPTTGRANRDEDYSADGLGIVIPKGSATGTVGVTITPLNVGDGAIQMTARDMLPGTGADEVGIQVYGIYDYTLPTDAGTDNSEDPTLQDGLDETTAITTIGGLVD